MFQDLLEWMDLVCASTVLQMNKANRLVNFPNQIN
jgi:hypothetical protein